MAYADQFIKRLPNGYQTVLSGDGEELSQGQRQLLAIARAAVADPRTVFVIALRLYTIRNSDAIIVLEHERIIERGAHEKLIRQKGVYYEL